MIDHVLHQAGSQIRDARIEHRARGRLGRFFDIASGGDDAADKKRFGADAAGRKRGVAGGDVEGVISYAPKATAGVG